jgi:hypothetical protein
LFMRSGRWGPWYDEVTEDDLLATPLRVTDGRDGPTKEIASAIDALRGSQPGDRPILGVEDQMESSPLHIFSQLDGAVYDLFSLSAAQRDLIDDFHAAQRDFALQRQRRPIHDSRVRVNAKVGTAADLDGDRVSGGGMTPYLRTFLAAWNRELRPDGELIWELHRSEALPILCVVFTTIPIGLKKVEGDKPQDQEWDDVLARLELVVNRPVSHELFVEGVLRSVTDSQIIVAKRDERRLWSASAAREDVEATMLRVIGLQRSS